MKQYEVVYELNVVGSRLYTFTIASCTEDNVVLTVGIEAISYAKRISREISVITWIRKDPLHCTFSYEIDGILRIVNVYAVAKGS